MNNEIPQPLFPDWDWIDGQQVMQLLKIGSDALKDLRRNGILSYTRLGNRCKLYYRLSEIKELMLKNLRPRK